MSRKPYYVGLFVTAIVSANLYAEVDPIDSSEKMEHITIEDSLEIENTLFRLDRKNQTMDAVFDLLNSVSIELEEVSEQMNTVRSVKREMEEVHESVEESINSIKKTEERLSELWLMNQTVNTTNNILNSNIGAVTASYIGWKYNGDKMFTLSLDGIRISDQNVEQQDIINLGDNTTYTSLGVHFRGQEVYVISDALSTSEKSIVDPDPSLASTIELEEPKMEETLIVFPNPTFDLITLKNIDNDEPYSIYSMSGRIVQQGRISDKQIDVQKLPAGNYVLTVRQKSTKFIKR